MKVKFVNRIPVSADITRHDYTPESIDFMLKHVCGESSPDTPEENLVRIRKTMDQNRDYVVFKHEYYEKEKLPAVQEIVRRIADTIDLIIPAAKGDSVYAQPLLTLLDQMIEFLSEMNAEAGPVQSPDGGPAIGSLFCDMASMELDFLTKYNQIPRALSLFVENHLAADGE